MHTTCAGTQAIARTHCLHTHVYINAPCRSTGPRAAAGRLSDLGAELEDADMAGMLPVVGEDEPLELGPEEGLAVPPSRKRLRLVGGRKGGGDGV